MSVRGSTQVENADHNTAVLATLQPYVCVLLLRTILAQSQLLCLYLMGRKLMCHKAQDMHQFHS